MKATKELTLIDGNFTTDEAKELLVNLFISKIKFHQMKNFSSQERYGKDDVFAVKKILLLKENVEQVYQIIEEAEAKNKILIIKSKIEFSYADVENI